MITVRHICGDQNAQIPESYHIKVIFYDKKKDQQIKEHLSLNLKKLKNLKSPMNSKSLVTKATTKIS